MANSQTLAALRFSRLARTSPGWLPLCQGRDRFIEIPTATGRLVVAVAQRGQEGGVQAGLADERGRPRPRRRPRGSASPACRVQAWDSGPVA